MPTPEEQRLLDQINNRKTEQAGWIAFGLGTLLTSLIFVWFFIPLTEQIAAAEALHEYRQTQSQCPSY